MVTLESGDLPFEEKRILSHSAGSIDGAVSDEIITELFSDPEFAAVAAKAGMTVNLGHSFRHIAVQSQADIKGIRLIPPHDHLGEKIGPLLPTGCKNADTLRELMVKANELLERSPINAKLVADGKMPANGIWFWAEGTAVKLPDFVSKNHHTGAVVSAVPLCHGIAALVGLGIVCPEGATGEIDTNYENKMQATLDILEDNDFAAVHVEAPDECGHRGEPENKVKSIEMIDSRVLPIIIKGLEEIGEDYKIMILPDHPTPIVTKTHASDPVPYMIYQKSDEKDSGVESINEESAKATGNYIDFGPDLMKKFIV